VVFGPFGLHPLPIDRLTAELAIEVMNSVLLTVYFPMVRGLGEAIRDLPGLVPFFEDQDFLSNTQHHTHTHTHTLAHGTHVLQKDHTRDEPCRGLAF